MSGMGPDQSSIRTNREIEEAISKATSVAEVQAIMRQAAIDQRLVVPDPYNQTILIPAEPGTQPRGYAKVITVNGVKHVLEGETQQELDAAEVELYRSIQTSQQTAEQETPEEAAERAKQAIDQNELRLKLMRGEITIDEVVSQHLTNIGVSPEVLGAISGAVLEGGWADATSEFLERHPEWLGGDENKNTIYRILTDNHLEDAPDKLDAMERAYQHAVANGLLKATPESEATDAMDSAQSPAEIQRALDAYKIVHGVPTGSSIFGR